MTKHAGGSWLKLCMFLGLLVHLQHTYGEKMLEAENNELMDGEQEIRMIEGINKLSESILNPDDEYHRPSPMYGPQSLFFLDGLCFQSAFDKYEYTICPFQNVTQRRLSNVRPVLLGVWGSWQEDTTPPYSIMQYPGGLTCGTHNRQVKLVFTCGHDSFSVLETEEPVTCSYVIKFGVPIPCSVYQQSEVIPRTLSEPVEALEPQVQQAQAQDETIVANTNNAAASTTASEQDSPKENRDECSAALQTLGRCIDSNKHSKEPPAPAAFAATYRDEHTSSVLLLEIAAKIEALQQQMQDMAAAARGVPGVQ